MDVEVGHTIVSTAAGDRALDVRVLEEDTYLVLSTSTQIRETKEHPIRLFTALHEQQPEPLGSIIERKGAPPKWLAVVLDLAADPPASEDVIARTLAAVFAKARIAGATRIGLELLGAQHRVLPVPVALALFFDALEKRPLDRICRIELQVPEGRIPEVERFLRSKVRTKEEGEA